MVSVCQPVSHKRVFSCRFVNYCKLVYFSVCILYSKNMANKASFHYELLMTYFVIKEPIRAQYKYPFLIFTFQEMRKEKAKRFNLNKSRISGRRVAITLGANTVAKIKGENWGGGVGMVTWDSCHSGVAKTTARGKIGNYKCPTSGELRVPHGPVPKGALCDYIEIQKGQDDAVLKFR